MSVLSIRLRFLGAALALLLAACSNSVVTAGSEESDPGSAPQAMTIERLDSLIRAVDETAKRPQDFFWTFNVKDVPVSIVADPKANRMRTMVAIADAKELGAAELNRLLQANFDSALDARYAVAHDLVWAVYLHPLRSLTDEAFLSGLGQTVNLATSYGSSFSSGLFTFRGGDSGALERRRLLEELLKRGEKV